MAIAEIDGKIEKIKNYDLRPQAIIEQLDLLKPIYRQTAQWGHFGHNSPWER
jgi:S-adenosylmethionine synthetase